MTRLVLVAGTTETAGIERISAAGANPDLLAHTPSADAEILTYGDVVRAPVIPVSPSGTPTPAVVTRAVREALGFDVAVVDGGLAKPTAAGTVTVGASPGRDIREQDPVPTAPGAHEAARQFGRALPDEDLVIAETVPGGTTTALGVLTALGEDGSVSSSLPDNPIERKREVVAAGLAASDITPGEATGQPKRALRRMGDPVLATAAGLARGALASGTGVTLGGGTQMLAIAALLRHGGFEGRLAVATTSFVAADDSATVRELAAELDVDLTVTDPEFGRLDHPALSGYLAGEAKEGVGMGGALALAGRASLPFERVGERTVTVADRLVDTRQGESA
jgi:uncharacterized protein (TIGR00303 family)